MTCPPELDNGTPEQMNWDGHFRVNPGCGPWKASNLELDTPELRRNDVGDSLDNDAKRRPAAPVIRRTPPFRATPTFGHSNPTKNTLILGFLINRIKLRNI